MGHNTKTRKRQEVLDNLTERTELLYKLARRHEKDLASHKEGLELLEPIVYKTMKQVEQIIEYIELPWWKRFARKVKVVVHHPSDSHPADTGEKGGGEKDEVGHMPDQAERVQGARLPDGPDRAPESGGEADGEGWRPGPTHGPNSTAG
jgi:hypothetical protein